MTGMDPPSIRMVGRHNRQIRNLQLWIIALCVLLGLAYKRQIDMDGRLAVMSGIVAKIKQPLQVTVNPVIVQKYEGLPGFASNGGKK